MDHCHGTLIVHADSTIECTDADCELGDLLRHAFIIDCTAMLGGCCAAEDRADFSVDQEARLAIAS